MRGYQLRRSNGNSWARRVDVRSSDRPHSHVAALGTARIMKVSPRPMEPARVPESLVIATRLLGTLRPYGRTVAVAYGAMIAVTGLTLAVPAIIAWVVDVALTPVAGRTEELVAVPNWLPLEGRIEAFARSAGTEILVWAAAAIVGLAVIRSGLAFVQLYLGLWLNNRVAYDLRNEYFAHLQRLPFRFHDATKTGDLMSRAVSDISKIQHFVGDGLLEAVNIPVLFVGVGALLIGLDAGLALVAIVPILLLALVTVRFGRFIEPLFKAVQDQEGALSTRAQENFTGARVVKAFAREQWEIERFDEANEVFFERRIKVIAGFADFFPTMAGIITATVALVLWFGAPRVLAGELTIGTLVGFNFWVLALAQPTQNLGFLVNRAAEAVASGRRLFEILDTQPEITDRTDAIELPQLAGRVTFEAVDFAYGPGAPPVLHDIDFEAEPNQVVAIFGPTGSGKSSLVHLIPRFYDATTGRVLVDGHDVRDVSLRSLRSQVAIVLQDAFLFSASVRDNIAYGARYGGVQPSQAEIEAAARAARADDFIEAMPAGYDTVIGERGITLSGGQRQRLAIARAIVMKPRILILDDALSAVDTETEFEIQTALREVMRGRTTFVIAHRLLSLKHADQILVMDGGRIVERGSHDALVAHGGLYARIYELQLREQESAARSARAGQDGGDGGGGEGQGQGDGDGGGDGGGDGDGVGEGDGDGGGGRR